MVTMSILQSALARIAGLRWASLPMLAGALWLLALPGSALAAPVMVGSVDDTDCLDKETIPSDRAMEHDPVNGNFWARRDIFSVTSDEGCFSAQIDGISIVLKTPFQIDSTPDVDDLDTDVDDFLALQSAMQAMPDLAGFHPEYGGNAVNEAGGGPPHVGLGGSFLGARICIEVVGPSGGSLTVDDCLNGSGQIELADIGGGTMIFSVELDDSIFLCDPVECTGASAINLVTLAFSNQTNAPGSGESLDIPELIAGWRFTELTNVPEPSVVALLAPALLAASFLHRRRGTRSRS